MVCVWHYSYVSIFSVLSEITGNIIHKKQNSRVEHLQNVAINSMHHHALTIGLFHLIHVVSI